MPLSNGHVLHNGNGTTGGVATPTPAALSWRQTLWNSWDAFADVVWFIICSLGYIFQVSSNDIRRFIYTYIDIYLYLICSMSKLWHLRFILILKPKGHLYVFVYNGDSTNLNYLLFFGYSKFKLDGFRMLFSMPLTTFN